jgi:CelD/BcsL family acetyltransferase involved in cellulose biosynthesis
VPTLRSVVVRSPAEFAPVAADWDRLAGRFGRALLRHDWFLTCAETLHRAADLRVVLVHRDGRLVAAAPLVLARDGWVSRLQILGMSALYEPSGLLYEDEDALSGLASRVAALGYPIVLQRLDAGAPVSAAFRRALGRRGVTLVRPTSPSAAVVVRAPWPEFEATLSSQIRSALRRHRTRAGKSVGDVSTEVLAPAVADVDALLDVVVAVEGSGWKGRNGSALRCRPDLQAFFRAYARRAAAAGRLRVALLRFGGRVAAVELAVEDFNRWWQLKIGFDEALRPFYPGLQLTLETVRRAFHCQLDSFEFLGSVAPWEERWHPEARGYEACIAYPASLRGGAALADDVARVALRRFRRPPAPVEVPEV